MYTEPHRPRVHFSLPRNWMNDPNGLVYANGVFHMFYQHNPFSSVWGPMHWGHAISEDLIHWQHLPTALSPNELGAIFSGCALVDEDNVTGLQLHPTTKPLIAIFTQHLETGENNQLQQQCLAYSVDNGYNWLMYKNNPIIPNPGIIDFRDPKVFKHEKYYYLVLAAGNRVQFYKSRDLLEWTYLSEFGANHGSHDGVWECPDLFPMQVNGKEYWVLLVSINPGGPNGGSATQYFIGDFDGEKFENYYTAEKTLWIDYGPDCYAGITWFGTGSKNRCFIGWMNNWSYGNDVPTYPWRGQMTIPRTLSLGQIGDEIYLLSNPVPMITKLHDNSHKLIYLNGNIPPLNVGSTVQLSGGSHLQSTAFDVKIIFDTIGLNENDYFELIFGNEFGESVSLRYSHSDRTYRFDRSQTQEVNFHNSFHRVSQAPRLINDRYIVWRIVVDVSSIELFADEGLTLLTSLYYAKHRLKEICLKFSSNDIHSSSILRVNSACFYDLNSIWNSNELKSKD